MSNYTTLLQRYWGYTNFRPLQEDIIQTLLEKKQDVLAVLPTGGGKSLCYQLPALASNGLCLVISPLIALMEDQVQQLKKKGISAAFINSSIGIQETENIIKEAIHNRLHLLYLSPERVNLASFLPSLQQLPITFMAIDEAHCISEWGFDFRPDYLHLKKLRSLFPMAPLLALTATATPDTQEDIKRQLSLHHPAVFIGDFRRPNLAFSVQKSTDKELHLYEILQKYPTPSSLIYCSSRQQTEIIASFLKKQHIQAEAYHAGMSPMERKEKQESWFQEKINTMVCTSAFGMGIDKGNVGLVVHHSPPLFLEQYYQEAGRAGRNGQQAQALLLYNDTDLYRLKKAATQLIPNASQLHNVYHYLFEHLDIPIGDGESLTLPFDKTYFLKKHTPLISTRLLQAALTLLAQLGYFQLHPKEHYILQLRILVNKATLITQTERLPALQDLLELLLRRYPFISTQWVNVYPEDLAQRSHLSRSTLQRQLQALTSLGLIAIKEKAQNQHIIQIKKARPMKNTPLCPPSFLKNITQKMYHKTNAILAYIEQGKLCRSYLLDRYFAPTRTVSFRCGQCDNCRA